MLVPVVLIGVGRIKAACCACGRRLKVTISLAIGPSGFVDAGAATTIPAIRAGVVVSYEPWSFWCLRIWLCEPVSNPESAQLVRGGIVVDATEGLRRSLAGGRRWLLLGEAHYVCVFA
jgi:hypothetical protein